MDLAERLRTFITYKGMGISEFADRAGIPRPTLSQLLSGRNKSVNDLFVKRLHNGFPDLNIVWFLFNEGEMVSGANSETSAAQNGAQIAIDEAADAGLQDVTEARFPSLFDRISEQNSKNRQNAPIEAQERAENLAKQPSSVNPGLSGPAGINPAGANLAGTAAPLQPTSEPAGAVQPEHAKRIKNIMVFYTDNSYEIFHPTPEK